MVLKIRANFLQLREYYESERIEESILTELHLSLINYGDKKMNDSLTRNLFLMDAERVKS